MIKGEAPSGKWIGAGRKPPPVDEPKPPQCSIDDPMPEPSPALSEKGRMYWFGWIGERVRALRVLTVSDLAALEILCETYADYIEARELVRNEGAYTKDLMRITAPAKRLDKLAKDLQTQMRDFGLNPRARAEVKTGKNSMSGGSTGKEQTNNQGQRKFFGSRG